MLWGRNPDLPVCCLPKTTPHTLSGRVKESGPNLGIPLLHAAGSAGSDELAVRGPNGRPARVSRKPTLLQRSVRVLAPIAPVDPKVVLPVHELRKHRGAREDEVLPIGCGAHTQLGAAAAASAGNSSATVAAATTGTDPTAAAATATAAAAAAGAAAAAPPSAAAGPAATAATNPGAAAAAAAAAVGPLCAQLPHFCVHSVRQTRVHGRSSAELDARIQLRPAVKRHLLHRVKRELREPRAVNTDEVWTQQRLRSHKSLGADADDLCGGTHSRGECWAGPGIGQDWTGHKREGAWLR
eukprot:357548-Chlamydomonas_euryale.AAC.2